MPREPYLIWGFDKQADHKYRICLLVTGRDLDFLEFCQTVEGHIGQRLIERLKLFARLGKFGSVEHGKMLEAGLWEVRAYPHGGRALMSAHSVRGVFVVVLAFYKKRGNIPNRIMEEARRLAKLAKELPLPEDD